MLKIQLLILIIHNMILRAAKITIGDGETISMTRRNAIDYLKTMVDADNQTAPVLRRLYSVGVETRFFVYGLPDTLYIAIINEMYDLSQNDMVIIDDEEQEPFELEINFDLLDNYGASQANGELNPRLHHQTNFCPNGVCTQPVTLSGIWNYGCWCNFGERLMKGQSKPVNIYDSVCKQLQQCLRCARTDGVDDGYECDPTTKVYNSGFTFLPFGNTAINAACSAINAGDQCAIHCCACELDLINELLTILWSGTDVYSPQFLHSEGFEMHENCPTGHGAGSKHCCGWYPDRFPYQQQKDCCSWTQTVFNPDHKECCDGGTVATRGVFQIGTCP